MRNRSTWAAIFLFALGGSVFGQSSGIPASDILGSWDLWRNPTVVGGVSNAGANAHGIW